MDLAPTVLEADRPASEAGVPSGRLAEGQRRLRRRADLDLARLQLLRHLAYQLDVEQAVGQRRTLDLDMVSQLEAPLEGASGDAAMQVLRRRRITLLGLAGHGQGVLMDGDVDLVGRETRHRHGDAVILVAGL